jgi:hypothetical protein
VTFAGRQLDGQGSAFGVGEQVVLTTAVAPIYRARDSMNPDQLHSWMNRFRKILIRWEKREDTYLAMLHLALGIIT